MKSKTITPSHLTTQALAYRDTRAAYVRATEAVDRAKAALADAELHVAATLDAMKAHADELLQHAAALELSPPLTAKS